MKMRKTIAVGAALTMGFSAAMAEKILHRGNGAEPATLDPHFASGVWENNIIGDMMMGLTTYNAKGKVIPGLAKSWTISKEGRTYTFKIRDAKWSDGKKITANDFEFSLKRILKPETAAKYAFILYPIQNAEDINKGTKDIETLGVKAIDSKTLRITLGEVTPFFLEQLTHYTSWAVPEHVVKKHGSSWAKPGTMVVSGAFNVAEWEPQSHIKLMRNPQFFDAKNVKLDVVYYYPTEDRHAEFKRYRAGELHITKEVPSGQAKKIRQEFGSQFRVAPYLGTYYYPLNTQKIKDVRVREALNLAINREVISNKILGEGQVPAYSYVPLGINNYVSSVPEFEFKKMSQSERLKRAKMLMEQAGYSKSKPLEMELKYNTSEAHKKVAVAISSMWKQIHVKVSFFNQEAKVHYADLTNGEFEVARAGWIGDYNDPTTFLDLFGDNQYNYGRWKNAKFNGLMTEAKKMTNLDQRAVKLAEAEKMVLGNFATIPIYYYVSASLVKPNVTGYEDNIMDIHRSRWISLK